MNKLIIDTNAVLSYLTDRNPDQQLIVLKIVNEIDKNDGILYCPSDVLSELVYVSKSVYNFTEEEIKTQILSLFAIPQIEIVSQMNIQSILEIWGNPVSGYLDSVIASISLSNQNIPILTFDKKFRTSLKKLNIPILPEKI